MIVSLALTMFSGLKQIGGNVTTASASPISYTFVARNCREMGTTEEHREVETGLEWQT